MERYYFTCKINNDTNPVYVNRNELLNVRFISIYYPLEVLEKINQYIKDIMDRFLMLPEVLTDVESTCDFVFFFYNILPKCNFFLYKLSIDGSFAIKFPYSNDFRGDFVFGNESCSFSPDSLILEGTVDPTTRGIIAEGYRLVEFHSSLNGCFTSNINLLDVFKLLRARGCDVSFSPDLTWVKIVDYVNNIVSFGPFLMEGLDLLKLSEFIQFAFDSYNHVRRSDARNLFWVAYTYSDQIEDGQSFRGPRSFREDKALDYFQYKYLRYFLHDNLVRGFIAIFRLAEGKAYLYHINGRFYKIINLRPGVIQYFTAFVASSDRDFHFNPTPPGQFVQTWADNYWKRILNLDNNRYVERTSTNLAYEYGFEPVYSYCRDYYLANPRLRSRIDDFVYLQRRPVTPLTRLELQGAGNFRFWTPTNEPIFRGDLLDRAILNHTPLNYHLPSVNDLTINNLLPQAGFNVPPALLFGTNRLLLPMIPHNTTTPQTLLPRIVNNLAPRNIIIPKI